MKKIVGKPYIFKRKEGDYYKVRNHNGKIIYVLDLKQARRIVAASKRALKHRKKRK